MSDGGSTERSLVKLIILVGEVVAALLALGALLVLAVNYLDRDRDATLQSIDRELRVQNCQRLERTDPAVTYEKAQRLCAERHPVR